MASSGTLAAAGVLGAGAIGATSVGTYYAINKPGVEAEPTAVISEGSDQPSNSVTREGAEQLPSNENTNVDEGGDSAQNEKQVTQEQREESFLDPSSLETPKVIEEPGAEKDGEGLSTVASSTSVRVEVNAEADQKPDGETRAESSKLVISFF
ncbi:hypothetical protein [Candidatus Mycoplasma haematohominis]|uniref:Uncharacterized protein n=1 Tax=Candidatus Mycoplasma haematohominis TaxID=1494318 RepID=A0A478FP71_9MOLU|nr:hypothetical protein [Candidatus Mycoplasma haemohominis]GCE63093.1 hypothetical protein MHSWG343_00710 [Candidatus Mycoplasma haemohominis]